MWLLIGLLVIPIAIGTLTAWADNWHDTYTIPLGLLIGLVLSFMAWVFVAIPASYTPVSQQTYALFELEDDVYIGTDGDVYIAQYRSNENVLTTLSAAVDSSEVHEGDKATVSIYTWCTVGVWPHVCTKQTLDFRVPDAMVKAGYGVETAGRNE